MINYLKRWFNHLVHQAIIDGIALYRERCKGHRDTSILDENERQQQAIFLLIGLEVWIAIIFVIVAKVVG